MQEVATCLIHTPNKLGAAYQQKDEVFAHFGKTTVPFHGSFPFRYRCLMCLQCSRIYLMYV